MNSVFVGRLLRAPLIKANNCHQIRPKKINFTDRNVTKLINIRWFSLQRKYSEKHEWILLEGDNIGRVGISDHAQDALGDVVYVQMPDIGMDVKQFEEVGAIESVKAASELLTPASGSVIEINTALEEKPALINTSCYDQGWLFKLKLKNVKELDKLMDENAYKDYLEKSKV